MATATKLTLHEFRVAYSDRKPHYEYWFGEARQKAMPTWLHRLLQAILCDFLMRAGYRAGSEIELRIDPEWEPVPDVVGALTIEVPYPTRPVDIVIEILSPTDSASDVLDKCRQYARIGIRKILVADPERMEGWEWVEEQQRLQHVEAFDLPNRQSIPLADVWARLRQQIESGNAETEPVSISDPFCTTLA